MALTTFTELKAAIADFLDRSDLTAAIPDFITLAEVGIKHDKRNRFLANETRATATLTAASQYLALPAGFVRIKRMHFTTTPQHNIEITSRDTLNDRYISSTGKPNFVTVADGQFEFNRISDSAYTVEIIFDKFLALSGSNATNQVFPEYSNIYLYGSLVQAAIYLRDRELRAEMHEEYLNAVKIAKAGDDSARYGGKLRARTLAGT